MERLRGPAHTISSLLKLCLERDKSLLGNERVTENETENEDRKGKRKGDRKLRNENGFENQQYPYI
jgi:hypothetical protein